MAWSLGGFLQKMLHSAGKPPKFVAISRFGKMPRAFACSLTLNPQKFDFGRHLCLPALRMTYRNKQTGARMYYVYILASKANAMLYIGVTNDLRRRLREHRNGEIDGFTKTYSIHKLVFFEEFSDITDAIACEKRRTRAKKNALVESKNPNWVDLSEGFI
jgi:putative endonuclease